MPETSYEHERAWSQRNSIISLAAIVLAGILFLYIAFEDRNMIWKDVYGQLIVFLLNSEEQFSPSLENSSTQISDIGIVAILGIIWLGFFNLLSKTSLQRIDSAVISFFLTLATIGVITMLLAIFASLYQPTIVSVALAVGITINLIFFQELKRNLLSLRRIKKFPNLEGKKILLLVIPITLTFGFSFFYTNFLPVIDFDALIYHAEMAKIIFEEHSVPVFKGPSIGIEISGNYPPLFSTIAAGLYTLIGRFDDVLLRILPTLFGFPLVLGIYRIGEKVFRTSGVYSVLLLLSTPLFIHNLIISSPTSLIAACIVLAVYGIVNIHDGDLKKNHRSHLSLHLILTGVFMGLALLSSYQSLFYIAVPIATLLLLFFRYRNQDIENHNLARMMGTVLVIAILLGSIWYIRNFIHHQNPFYPWLFSPEGDEATIFEETRREIQTVGSIVTFGKLDYDAIDIRSLFRFHPALFPAFSSVSIIGIVLLLYKSPMKFLWLAIWMTLPILLIFSLGTVFPRYLLPLLPPLIISFGFIVAYATRNTSFQRTAKISTLVLILLLYAFIGLPVAISNPSVNVGNFPDKMFFVKHAGNKEVALQVFYDGDVQAWKWITENASPDEKVATFDPRLYYMGNYTNIFPLDGRDAVPLYSMTDSGEIKDFLEKHEIKYIYDASSPNSRLYQLLPLTRELGTDEYPEILNPGFAHIYSVNNMTAVE